MKRFLNVAMITVFGTLYGLCGTAFGLGVGDVTIHLNGGEDIAHVGEVNTLEIWLANDAKLSAMSLPFKITFSTALAWDMGYGSTPPVNEHGRAIGCWDLTGLMLLNYLDDISLDSILLGGVALMQGLPAGASELCYTLQFFIPDGAPYVNDGISIVPTSMSSQIWGFQDVGGMYPPDFNGNPTGSTTNPVAPPVTFDIVPSYVCGDVNCDYMVNLADAVYTINYIFKGGPAPCADCP